MQVEINNTCNLRCIMCPREAMTRKARYMTFEEFRRVTDECRALGTPRLRLFLLGEPLLHPELEDMVAYAVKAGIPSVEFNTNAALLTEDKARGLIAAGLHQVVFSLDGIDAATYEHIRVGGRFDAVMANVEAFCRLAREAGERAPRTIVQTIVMQDTRDQIAAFRKRWEAVADRVEVQCLREYHGVEAGRTTTIHPDDELRPCPALWEYMVILADGRVVPCCVDINGDMTLADANTADLRALWRGGEALSKLRRQHLRYDYRGLPLCRGCEFTNVSLLKRKAAESGARAEADE